MSCFIDIPDGELYVRLTVLGSVVHQELGEHIVRAQAFGRENGIDRFLVDLRGCRNLAHPQNLIPSVNQVMSEAAINPRALVVVLVDPDDHTHDFMEVAGRAKGFDHCLFRNPSAAVERLRTSSSAAASR